MVKADDLELMGELGRGAYGVVDKMRHVPSGLIMAVKVGSSSRSPPPLSVARQTRVSLVTG